MAFIKRPDLLARIEHRFHANPVVLLLGPRQCGKTTLARAFAAAREAEYYDLESPHDAGRLMQPMTSLEPLEGWVIIDEAPRRHRILTRRSSSLLFLRRGLIRARGAESTSRRFVSDLLSSDTCPVIRAILPPKSKISLR